jgi:hypothetical protein
MNYPAASSGGLIGPQLKYIIFISEGRINIV